jgi:hypothetical protein
MDKANYPANWREISLRTRERDGWACKWCGLEHNAIIRRLEDGESYTYYGTYTTKAEWDTKWSRATPKLVRIVLTVAHINHDTSDNSDANLAALCQRCHLRHDAQQHASNASRTRRARKVNAGQMEIDLV